MAIFGKSYQYYLGYALGGGGARGFAHLGALKVLERYRLKPDVIAGTSAGALAGVFYADGFTPDEIGELFQKNEMREFFDFSLPKAGIFKTSGIRHFLQKNLRARTFDQLRIPFMSVATDWQKIATVVFTGNAPLIDSVVASCSVPIVFNPVIIDDVPYVDGGLLRNYPVSVIRDLCKFVIGVNVSLMSEIHEKINIRKVAERTFSIMSNYNSMYDKFLSDITIDVEGLQDYTMFDLRNIDKIKELGYLSAVDALGTKQGLKLIRRCHHHYALEAEVKAHIHKLGIK